VSGSQSCPHTLTAELSGLHCCCIPDGKRSWDTHCGRPGAGSSQPCRRWRPRLKAKTSTNGVERRMVRRETIARLWRKP